jgi:hypothetical protein
MSAFDFPKARLRLRRQLRRSLQTSTYCKLIRAMNDLAYATVEEVLKPQRAVPI